MSIVADQGKITPRSGLRHRPIGTTSETVPITPRSSRLGRKQHEPHTSGGLPSTAPAKGATSKPEARSYPHAHPLVLVGLAMTTTMILMIGLQIALSVATTVYNDVRYGRPRTYQVDAVVGHNDSAAHPTHLVAMNLGGHIVVLEIPGGDASHARMLVGPTLSGDGADLVPVTLQLVDRQGNHQPDLLVRCGSVEVWFRNERGSFTAQ
ncbi:MAG TPA: hypothetical protein VFB60_24535 [Ktedonobacteraceae bacterium]|nr:hypothetical protein [Ktedonobacteraceae bacterium]